ncbi:MAG: hypothetical protein ACXABY_11760 [Candidatus Thorarchaeota archaeon]
MNEEQQTAIKEAIRKWERICSSLVDLDEATFNCSLCYQRIKLSGVGQEAFGTMSRRHQYLHCRKYCPLGDNGCLTPKSPWLRIDNFMSRATIEFLFEAPDHIIDACEAMYNNLCDLLPEYDPHLDPEVNGIEYRESPVEIVAGLIGFDGGQPMI